MVRWVHGFQIAAALLCASAPSPAAERLERLLALLTGPDDWAAAAALLGLRALGRSAPELRAAILDAVRPLLPAVDAPLPPLALALAVLGGDRAEGGGPGGGGRGGVPGGGGVRAAISFAYACGRAPRSRPVRTPDCPAT